MLPWLFNMYMGDVMREVRKPGDIGVSMRDKSRNCEWKAKWLMFAE